MGTAKNLGVTPKSRSETRHHNFKTLKTYSRSQVFNGGTDYRGLQAITSSDLQRLVESHDLPKKQSEVITA